MLIFGKRKPGFTLIELLVVFGLFAIIMVTIVSSLFAVLMRSRKAEALKTVEHNGTYVLRIMENALRGAKEVSQFDEAGGSYIEVSSADGDLVGFAFESGRVNWYEDGLAGGAKRLTDPRTELIAGAEFSYDEGGFDYPDLLMVKFSLQKAGNASLPIEDRAVVNFETRISLRNF